MSNIKITDSSGQKPVFTQWDSDRVLLITGCESQPFLHFANDFLTRAIVVESEAITGGYSCKVPNFALQFAGPMVVSVFLQPDEGYTAARIVIPVKPKMKPQDYTYTENIGYVNWVQKSAQAQALIDEIQEKLDSGDFKGDKGDAFTYADFTEEQLAALKGPKGDTGDTGQQGAQGEALTWDDLTDEQKASLKGETGPRGAQGPQGVKGDAFTFADFTEEQLASLKGPQGPEGQRGPQGERGLQGLRGETGPQGPSGADGQDATVDATLSNAGEAADAAETGKVKHTADYALTFAETLNSGNGIPVDGAWERGGIGTNGNAENTRTYRARTKNKLSYPVAITLKAASGYRFHVAVYKQDGTFDYVTDGTASRDVPANTIFRLVSKTYPEDTSVLADPDEFGAKITIQNNIGSGSSITVDSALSSSSENPVQNKVIKAALDNKGTYSKPNDGIPKTDLAEAVQTSLGKADTALQPGDVTEPLVATYTIDSLPDGNPVSATCDKTFSELATAMYAGTSIVCLVKYGAFPLAITGNVTNDLGSSINASVVFSRDMFGSIVHNSDDTCTVNVGVFANGSIVPGNDAPVSGDTVYNALLGKLDINQGSGNAGKFLVVGSDGNVTTKVQTEEVTVSTAGDVTQALDPGKIYHFTGAVSSLTLTLTSTSAGQIAQYHFDFDSGSTAATVTITGVTWQGGSFTPSASKHYEVDILNGYGVVCEW